MLFSKFARTAFLSLSSLLLLSGTALADMNLSSAKHAGLIGEKQDGLVAATLPNPSPEISSLVVSTNRGRMDVYKQTAAKEGIPVSEVQKIAAEKMFGMAASGEFLMIDGKWVRK